jgi:hypothetical protein
LRGQNQGIHRPSLMLVTNTVRIDIAHDRRPL